MFTWKEYLFNAKMFSKFFFWPCTLGSSVSANKNMIQKLYEMEKHTIEMTKHLTPILLNISRRKDNQDILCKIYQPQTGCLFRKRKHGREAKK